MTEFREQELPILWTNYARVPGDGLITAQDRYYGPQGVDGEYNPSFVYGPKGATTMTEIAPRNDEELSRTIQSLHLSKFADLDEDGREILFPMLEAWGVNTIILCGAWTDACIAATAYDAVDKYGYDVIMVRDGVASGTMHGEQMKSALFAANCCEMTSKQIVKHMQDHPDMTEKPKAPLNGNVYKTHESAYRQDYHVQKIEELKNQIAELEAKLVSRS
jgi:nicotinamidase-related amidase